jgi:hypothetical protein
LPEPRRLDFGSALSESEEELEPEPEVIEQDYAVSSMQLVLPLYFIHAWLSSITDNQAALHSDLPPHHFPLLQHIPKTALLQKTTMTRRSKLKYSLRQCKANSSPSRRRRHE